MSTRSWRRCSPRPAGLTPRSRGAEDAGSGGARRGGAGQPPVVARGVRGAGKKRSSSGTSRVRSAMQRSRLSSARREPPRPAEDALHPGTEHALGLRALVCAARMARQREEAAQPTPGHERHQRVPGAVDAGDGPRAADGRVERRLRVPVLAAVRSRLILPRVEPSRGRDTTFSSRSSGTRVPAMPPRSQSRGVEVGRAVQPLLEHGVQIAPTKRPAIISTGETSPGRPPAGGTARTPPGCVPRR
jgi:hypothetical protein